MRTREESKTISDTHAHTHICMDKQTIKFQPKHDSYYTNTYHFTPSFLCGSEMDVFFNYDNKMTKSFSNFFVFDTHPISRTQNI